MSEASITVDYQTQTIGLNLQFLERNRMYDTTGLIQVRNSYVLNERKPDAGSSNEDE